MIRISATPTGRAPSTGTSHGRRRHVAQRPQRVFQPRPERRGAGDAALHLALHGLEIGGQLARVRVAVLAALAQGAADHALQARGQVRLSAVTGRVSSKAIACSVSTGELPVNGACPVTIS